MFVGYYLDGSHKQIEFLETTMLGSGHQPTLMKNVSFGTLYPAQTSESWKGFTQAVETADKTFQYRSPARATAAPSGVRCRGYSEGASGWH